MNLRFPTRRRPGRVTALWLSIVPILAIGTVASTRLRGVSTRPAITPAIRYESRTPFDSSVYIQVNGVVKDWAPDASLAEIADRSRKNIEERNRAVDREIASNSSPNEESRFTAMMTKVMLNNSAGRPAEASKMLERARALAESRIDLSTLYLYSVIYYQGLSALRRGENENCIMCRGESSCILPISPSARHTKPDGSRAAIRYFSEYLGQFPNDLEVRWLLNLAHMTLGEHPDKVDPRYLVSLDHFTKSEFDIGKFRDVGERAGVNRFNQAGGAIMEDFDGDDLLDVVVTSFDPSQHTSFYRNQGDGTFEDRTESSGVKGQLGGLYCVQADYNNDGLMDIFIPRGAWVSTPMRPSLLRNDGGKFTDVTAEAGVLDPMNSITASWADYDNDGWVDLFVSAEIGANRLFHNKGDGTFEEVARKAGLAGDGHSINKGQAWIDFDNDGDSDLYVNHLGGVGELYRNDGKGSFEDMTLSLGINGPRNGFSCWAWDYDNDGWLDIFATSYDRTVEDIVKGLTGQPHSRATSKLFRNMGGGRFVDMSKQAGLDSVYATMGSNFADFDNDGFLDFYLGTGEPSLAMLVPNRLFKNVDGKRFAEITAPSGTGHLQKGHAVACGDWDRDGDVDIFIQTGGAVDGDKYHNVLFENPGQGNHWLEVKLVGKKTNRAAIGARIKAVTGGDRPATVYRHVSSGSSFGANPLRQHIGLAVASRVVDLEVHWPTSGTTQVFHDIAADQSIEIAEFEEGYRKIDLKPAK